MFHRSTVNPWKVDGTFQIPKSLSFWFFPWCCFCPRQLPCWGVFAGRWKRSSLNHRPATSSSIYLPIDMVFFLTESLPKKLIYLPIQTEPDCARFHEHSNQNSCIADDIRVKQRLPINGDFSKWIKKNVKSLLWNMIGSTVLPGTSPPFSFSCVGNSCVWRAAGRFVNPTTCTHFIYTGGTFLWCHT